MASGKNRKHSKIDKLPENIKDTVEQMMQADFTYNEIADYIRDCGFEISTTSVWRHATNLNATVETLRMAQENFRVIMDEIAKYPQLDTSEGIIRLLSHHVIEAINNTNEEQWKEIDPMKLIQQANALVRASSYKSNMDIKNKDIMDAGLEQVKTLVFEAMARENPKLYSEVTQFLKTKTEVLR
ncbi:MAG: phage protein Gp27 family protein [Eubacterium sp.]